jgi:molybdenum cofactor guanylyltransferase
MQDTIALAVLAGGQGRRLGGVDKALLEVVGQPLLAHVLDRVRPQVRQIVLSANGAPERFAGFDLPVVADSMADAGPLAGIAAAAGYVARTWPAVRWLVTLPVDTPCPPADLVARLVAAAANSQAVAVAVAGDRTHWGMACWPLATALQLEAAVRDAGWRRLEDAVRAAGLDLVPFANGDGFANINRPEDVLNIARLLRRP